MMITAEVKKSLAAFTIEEIDEQLKTLTNLLRTSRNADKEEIYKRIDKWLDKRNRALRT